MPHSYYDENSEHVKQCSKCKNIKSVSEYQKTKKNKDGLQTECKVCKSISAKEYYNKNRKTLIEKSRNAKDRKKYDKTYSKTMKRFYSLKKQHAAKRNKQFNLSLEYIEELFKKQNGICPYTNWKLEFAIGKLPNQASLDCIDPKLGYREGNVEWVSYIYNLSKNVFSHEQVLSFCRDIVSNNDLKNK